MKESKFATRGGMVWNKTTKTSDDSQRRKNMDYTVEDGVDKKHLDMRRLCNPSHMWNQHTQNLITISDSRRLEHPPPLTHTARKNILSEIEYIKEGVQDTLNFRVDTFQPWSLETAPSLYSAASSGQRRNSPPCRICANNKVPGS